VPCVPHEGRGNSREPKASSDGEPYKPDEEGTIKHAGVSPEGENFAVMDSARAYNFTFNEAISFMVHCDTQEQIDHFWSKLSAEPKAERCGWLKDKFGLSWQIVPAAMDEMLSEKDESRLARVTEAFLKMKKFDIAKLNEAYGQAKSAA
jgi:predicted 3-demethylubiquinone-9 3-methyltransferase (glyoxalase superfamily)